LSFLVENGGAEVNNESFEVEGFQNPLAHAAHAHAQFPSPEKNRCAPKEHSGYVE